MLCLMCSDVTSPKQVAQHTIQEQQCIAKYWLFSIILRTVSFTQHITEYIPWQLYIYFTRFESSCILSVICIGLIRVALNCSGSDMILWWTYMSVRYCIRFAILASQMFCWCIYRATCFTSEHCLWMTPLKSLVCTRMPTSPLPRMKPTSA